MTIIASPTATSAAAISIMNRTRICADGSLVVRDDPIIPSRPAFNMSSTHIKATIAFRRIITPIKPIENRIDESMSMWVDDIIVVSLVGFRQLI